MDLPDFRFEQKAWKKGAEVVAGADEVGRGSFAGPVVVAVVVFDKSFAFSLVEQMPTGVFINDSKKITQKQRNIASIWIKDNALKYAITKANVAQINKLGIVGATNLAYRKALFAVNKSLSIDYLLVDGFEVPHARGVTRKKQLAITRGDSKSFSIAAASIIAKVHRDALIVKLGKSKDYKKYNWHNNKGYGTNAHRQAIIDHGPCEHHRTQFIETFLKKISLDPV